MIDKIAKFFLASFVVIAICVGWYLIVSFIIFEFIKLDAWVYRVIAALCVAASSVYIYADDY